MFGVLAVQAALLTVTGLVLLWSYTPAASGAVALAQDAHRALSTAMVPSAVVGAAVLALYGRGRRAPRGRGAPLATGFVLAAAALAASYTGFLLPWDQLALWTAEVGSNIQGYRWLGDESVRFVIVDGVEVAPDTLFLWMAVHVGLGVLVAGSVVAGWFALRAKPKA